MYIPPLEHNVPNYSCGDLSGYPDVLAKSSEFEKLLPRNTLKITRKRSK